MKDEVLYINIIETDIQEAMDFRKNHGHFLHNLNSPVYQAAKRELNCDINKIRIILTNSGRKRFCINDNSWSPTNRWKPGKYKIKLTDYSRG